MMIIDSVDGDGSTLYKEKKVDVTGKFENYNLPIAEVELLDLADIITSIPSKCRIILKLDVEGSEYEILNHLINTGVINRLNKLYAEFHHDRIGLPIEEHNKLINVLNNYNLIPFQWDAADYMINHKKGKRFLYLLKERYKLIYKIFRIRY